MSGAIGGAAGPAGGTLAKQFGRSATSTLATSFTGAINFLGGAAGNVMSARLNGQAVDLTEAVTSGTVNAGGGYLGGSAASGRGQNTLNQLSYFGTRSISGLRDTAASNTRALFTSAGVGTAVGSTYDLSTP